jgi:MerR family transcriptional regulator, copper efflux regulator
MNIGEVADASGVPAKMIRYYESIDLVKLAWRTAGGYRVYGQNDVDVLSFIHRARMLGFPIVQIRRLLTLWQDRDRANAEVRAVAAQHIVELEVRIAELVAMHNTLMTLVQSCEVGDRPSCPNLEQSSSADGEALDNRVVRVLRTRAS